MPIEAQETARERDPNSWISQDNTLEPEKRAGGLPEFTGPRTFGRLVLLKALARGGMGEVYLAALGDIEGAERPCVVKLIRHEHRDDASFLARFLDEARIQVENTRAIWLDNGDLIMDGEPDAAIKAYQDFTRHLSKGNNISATRILDDAKANLVATEVRGRSSRRSRG